MIEEEPASDPTYELPEEIGAVVMAHVAYRMLNKKPLPDAENPYDVLEVAQMVMNHTGIDSDELAQMIPAVRVLMGMNADSFSGSD